MSTENKLDKIADDITDLKVALVNQENNYKTAVDILDRLTKSVEEHIRRTDALEALVALTKHEQDVDLEKMKLDNQLKLMTLQADIDKKKSNDRMIWTVLVAVGGVIMALHQLGILQKLF